MNEIDKLAWLNLKDKRVLGARSRGKDTWFIPGGKRDPGESDQAALIREIQEELSVDLLPATITYANAFTAQAHGKPEGMMVKVSCYYADYTGEIKAAAEIEEVRWLAYADRKQCSAAAMLVMDWLNAQQRIE